MVLVGEASRRRAVAEFTEHYHRERHHQGLHNQLIEPLLVHNTDDHRILTRERLGGLLKYYYRSAA